MEVRTVKKTKKGKGKTEDHSVSMRWDMARAFI